MVLQGDCIEVLKTLDDNSVDCVITSPPYWALRRYGDNEKEIGAEKTYNEYLDNLFKVFDEVWRVLKNTGTCWVNLGDTYGTQSGSSRGIKYDYQTTYIKNRENGSLLLKGNAPYKSLIGIPDRFKIGMIDRGWICRNDIIWYKRNTMPTSARDRFTVDYERILFFTKSHKYYFEQQFERSITYATDKRARNIENKITGLKKLAEEGKQYAIRGTKYNVVIGKRNCRSVWDVPTVSSQIPHFAMFPERLVARMIKAGCPEEVCKSCGMPKEKIWEYEKVGKTKTNHDNEPVLNGRGQSGLQWSRPAGREFVGYTDCGCNAGYEKGVVLDPFAGAGNTLTTALKLGRRAIGIEIYDKYVEIINKRIEPIMKQTRLFI